MLLLSLITLFAGPLLHLWVFRGGAVARALDRAVVAVLIVLLAVMLIPETIRPLGWPALVLIVLGYLLPGLLERLVSRAAKHLHIASLWLALAGLLLHEALDGAGIASGVMQPDSGLAAAIVLHRFGVGLLLWLIIQPAFGQRAAWLLLAAMAAATVLGFELSERILPLTGSRGILWFQAVIIGTIIHSLVHRGHMHQHGPRESGTGRH